MPKAGSWHKKPSQGVMVNREGSTIVFLTICTKGRLKWLDCAKAHLALRQAWQEAEAWMIGRYLLMPDHLHLFCAPGANEKPFENWVRFWKSRFHRFLDEPTWEWQTGHWDTRLRRTENYASKWEYVSQNPVRAGLVVKPEDWPYQGVIHELHW